MFINKLANISYENIHELPMNNTFGLKSDSYLSLLYNLSWTFSPEISSGTANKFYLQDVVTELGICYAVNSKIAIYHSFELRIFYFK